MKSYGEAVKKSSGESVTLKKIKSAVKGTVEDRSRNLMILGLGEVAGEDLGKWLERTCTTNAKKCLRS